MNKGQLIEAVASELGDSKAAATRAVDAVIASISTGIKADEAVTIVGFGTFTKKHRAARTGRNPSTGEPMQINASKTVGFKPSQSLKEDLIDEGAEFTSETDTEILAHLIAREYDGDIVFCIASLQPHRTRHS